MNFERYLNTVNKGIKKYIPKPDGLNDTVVNAMEYSLLNGGKRIRPVIVLSSCDIFSGGFYHAVPYATAIEMIHTYSLIHDDLPAMDDDDYRRGRLSCHKRFNEWTAVLAGDALLNTAFEVMLSALYDCTEPELMKRHLKALAIITSAAGINGMISGQTADIEWEGKNPSIQTLMDINLKKTGALISASFEAGAVIGGASDSESALFKDAGKKIGLAFQIKDDMLDYLGEFENTGKQTGSDKKNNKTTYMTVLGQKGCSEMIEQISDEAIGLIRCANRNTAFLECLVAELINRIT